VATILVVCAYALTVSACSKAPTVTASPVTSTSASMTGQLPCDDPAAEQAPPARSYPGAATGTTIDISGYDTKVGDRLAVISDCVLNHDNDVFALLYDVSPIYALRPDMRTLINGLGIAPLGKHCVVILSTTSTTDAKHLSLVVMTRYNNMVNANVANLSLASELENEINYWRGICTTGNYTLSPRDNITITGAQPPARA
jgi:hypothetical protein